MLGKECRKFGAARSARCARLQRCANLLYGCQILCGNRMGDAVQSDIQTSADCRAGIGLALGRASRQNSRTLRANLGHNMAAR